MRQLQPVLWTKGVLLTPQHLQTQDRFAEALIRFQMSAVTEWPWGFARLQIDREALAGGVAVVSSAAGIFPDGLLFDVPGADQAPAPRPLEDSWRPDQTSLVVSLAVPEHRPGGVNVSGPGDGRSTRYLTDTVLLRDENTGLSEKPVLIGRKNLRLLTEGDSLEGSSVLPVARVLKLENGAYELDPRFVPPLLDLTASPYLVSLVRRVVEILAAKSAEIAAGRRQRNQSLAEFGVADVARFWLLYTVNTYLPQLRQLLEMGRHHPVDLHHTLVSLAGALTTFSQRIQPRDLPVYSHTDLSGCFSQLGAQVLELLETVVPTTHVSLPLRLVESSVYVTAVDDDRYLKAPEIYLAVKTNAPPAVMAKAPHLLKVGAADRMERLIRQALPGVQLTYTPRPPAAIPVKLDYQYFLLARDGPEWSAIVAARNVAAYVPQEITDVSLELVILLPAAGR
jgi:type VI secretion system protein ImpJ